MPKLTLEGDGSGAVKVFTDLDRAIGKVGDSLELTAKEAKKLEEAAGRVVKANEGPLDKYNRRLAELALAVKAGKLSMDEAERAAERYRLTLQRAGDTHQRSFGAQALESVGRMAAGMVSASVAVGALSEAFAEFQRVREKAAQQGFDARRGLGSLSQLAAGTDDPEGEFKKMVAEARGFVASGAAATEDEAGGLLFALSGAGLNEEDRKFAAQLKASGTLQNVGGAAEAYSALKTALGEGEVGGFQSFMSKALRAAGPAPGSFEQLPIAAARAGGSAAQLGVSDEFLLAATTILGKTTGSIDEGGTQLAALLRQVEKSGMKGTQGIGGVGILEKIKSLPEAQQGFGGVLGDRAEAVTAFRTLTSKDNMAMLLGLQGDVINAESSNLAGRAAGLSSGDPQLDAAMARAAAEGSRDVAHGEMFGESENLKKAALADIAKRRYRDQPGILAAADMWLEESKLLGPGWAWNTDRFLEATQTIKSERIEDPGTNKKIAAYLKRMSERQAAKAATRDE